MGELGLFGLPFPEEYGGSGSDFTTLCVAIEELARVDQSLSITLEAGVGLGANPIFQFGTEEQRQRWLPDLCAGRTLGGFGLTEPEAGSDAGGTRTRAVLDESTNEWVINGEKAFITNSGTEMTSIVTITARTDDARQHGGKPEISTIVVPAGTPASRSSPPTARWAGTRRTPTASPSPTAGCRPRTCSASGVGASPTSWPSSTTVGWPSPPWRSA
jgi:short/branched chain acyl-CoA dehydrogenase